MTTYVRIDTSASSADNKADYAELPLVTVTYMNGGGSVTENLYPVTFAKDVSYVTIPIVPVDDVMPESTENVQLRVVGIDSKYVASTNKYAVAEVLIADNDPFLAPVQKVYFGEGDLVAQPGSNAGMYVFKRTVADSYLTVNYTVGSTASGYTLGGGYDGNTSATFLPGISEVSVNLTMNTYGPPPTSGPVTLTITPSSNYEIIGSPSNTVEIYNVGGPGPWINVFRRVDPVGNTLNEGGSKGQFVVSRYYAYPNGPPPQSIPTAPPLPDFALGGTARAGLDYTATKQSTSVILPAIASSMVFVDGYEVEITPIEDNAYDSGEWVDFALIPSGQSNVPSSNGGPISVTLPISDAGTPPKPQISITTPDPNASELATSSGMYRIMRNDVNLPQTLTINYAFDETGLTDPATFGSDYSVSSKSGGLASSGNITFPAGVAMIEVKLTPVDNSELENDELAQLKLLSGSNYVVDAVKAQSQILITNRVPEGNLPTIVATSDKDLLVVNANNDNWQPGGTQSQWLNADQKFIPKVRDFNATNLWQDDKELVALTLTVGGWYSGTLEIEVYAPGEATVDVWKDKRKIEAFSPMQIQAGLLPRTITVYMEGTHESNGLNDTVRITSTFTTTNLFGRSVNAKTFVNVAPVLMNFTTAIPTTSVSFRNRVDPPNGLQGIIAAKYGQNVGDKITPGIYFSADVVHGGLKTTYVQIANPVLNGFNDPQNQGVAITLVNPAVNKIFHIKDNLKTADGRALNWPLLDAIAPGTDPEYNLTIKQNLQTTPESTRVIAEDSPSFYYQENNINERISRIDYRRDFIMYLIVQFADQSIYSFALWNWNVNILVTTRVADKGPTVIEPVSKVSADASFTRTNSNPQKTIGPVGNEAIVAT